MDKIDKKAEKPTTISFDEQLLGLTKAIESLEHKIDKSHPNYIEVVPLTNTNKTNLQFQNFSGNIPIQKLEVMAVGGGLEIWLNNSSFSVPCSVGSTIEAEITRLEYKVTSGTAYIMLFARIN
jgi:hypothetical protein